MTASPPATPAPPLPRLARPLEAWSSVVLAFATIPGLRKVFAPTMRPSLIFCVAEAQAPSVMYAS